MRDIFISFSSRETEEAERICRLLEENGYGCFISTRDLNPGEEYAAQLIDNIAGSRAVVLLLSENSNHSPHVLREVECAVSRKVPIIVYSLEQVKLSRSMEYYLMTHQWIPLGSDRDQVLLAGVGHLLRGESSVKVSGNLTVEIKAEKESEDTKHKNQKKNGWMLLCLCLGALLICCGIVFAVLTGREKDRPKQDPAAGQSLTGISQGTAESEETGTGKEEFKTGDTVIFGTYQEEPVVWRVLKVQEDGTLLLIAKEILCMKVFDVAEGGTYNEYAGVDYWSHENHTVEDTDLQVLIRGNNDWGQSNLRTWLNAENEVVNYPDQAPTMQAAGKNHYSSEPGFLYGFSDAEREALVPVKHSEMSVQNGVQETEDLVFLLSSKELELLKEAGIPVYAKPSGICQKNDKEKEGYFSFSNTYNVDSYYWWLRDNGGEKANEAYFAVTELEEGTDFLSGSVGACAYGVRPAVCVKITDAVQKP